MLQIFKTWYVISHWWHIFTKFLWWSNGKWEYPKEHIDKQNYWFISSETWKHQSSPYEINMDLIETNSFVPDYEVKLKVIYHLYLNLYPIYSCLLWAPFWNKNLHILPNLYWFFSLCFILWRENGGMAFKTIKYQY